MSHRSRICKTAHRTLSRFLRSRAFASILPPPQDVGTTRQDLGSPSSRPGMFVRAAGRRLMPALVGLALSSVVAHAQGTVDLSGVTSAMSSVETTAKLGGAIAVIIGIVFGVFQFMGRNIAQGFMAIGGGLFAGIVIGFAPQWVASLTGQSVSMVVAYAVQVLG